MGCGISTEASHGSTGSQLANSKAGTRKTTKGVIGTGPQANTNPQAVAALEATRQQYLKRKQLIQQRNNQIEANLSLSHSGNGTSSNSGTSNSNGPKGGLKLLMLGAGESGKSTVVKQMRLIHGSGFSERERVQYTGVIWSDAVQSMRILISSAHQLGIALESDSPGSSKESLELYEFNKLVMATDPVQLYEEDMTGLNGFGGGNSGSNTLNPGSNDGLASEGSRGFSSMVGSNGVPMPTRNFLDDYVLKYDRRRYNKYGHLNEEDDLIMTSKDDTGAVLGRNQYYGQNDEKEELLRDVDGEDKRDYYYNNNNNNNNNNTARSKNSSYQPYKKEQGKLATKAQVAHAIAELWKRDRGLHDCFRRANEFQLEVNAAYFFDRVKEYALPGYKATDQDILNGRIKTTGINETVICIQNWTFRFIDVGGQRSERRKWIHCFEDVTAIFFIAAVSEYDEVLFEDASMNRMAEALLLFESICNSRWFNSTLIILFLNKIDKLEKKLQVSPLGRYFRDYNSSGSKGMNSVDSAFDYFRDLFLALNRNQRRQIYVHPTCATDTGMMSFVIAAVTDRVIQRSLMEIGMI